MHAFALQKLIYVPQKIPNPLLLILSLYDNDNKKSMQVRMHKGRTLLT